MVSNDEDDEESAGRGERRLRVTALELPARWGDPLGALALVDDVLARGPETDLVLLPEASLTGYVSPRGDFDVRPFAEDHDGPTTQAVRALAARRRVHIVAPLVLRDRGRSAFHNAMIAADDAGEVWFTYVKRRPWIPERWATAGREPPPCVRIRDATVTICICYDVHFVARDAPSALARSDVLLFPTAWVDDDDDDLRDALLPALARRHRIAVVNANWAPGVVRVKGQGSSRILDATGRELVRTPPGGSGIARIDATLVVGDASRRLG